MKKILSLVIVFALCISTLCCGAAYADGFDYSRLADGYLAIGDSFTRGMYASDNWANEVYTIDTLANPNCRNVTGSYTLQLAKAFGCSTPDDITDLTGTYWPYAQFGLTLAMVLDLMGIEDNFYDAEFKQYFDKIGPRYETSLYYFGDPESVNASGDGVYGQTGVCGSIRNHIKDSKVITVALGVSDVLNTPTKILPGKYLKGIDTSDTVQLAKAVASCVEFVYERFEYFVNSYPLLLDYLKANATGDVVIIGATNPLGGIYLKETSLYPIGNAVSLLTAGMNEKFKAWCEEYGFIYVDISNVELGGGQNELSVEAALGEGGGTIIDAMSDFSPDGDVFGMATHPTKEGYAQITREVLCGLAEKHADEKLRKTDIRVDLGRFDKVDYVMVDGKLVTDYTVENSLLTVHNGSSKCCTLTTAVVYDGKLSVTVYQLSFDWNSGYSVYRLYTTNSVLTVALKIKTTVANIASKLFGKLKK